MNLDALAIVISIIMGLSGIFISFLIARKYGDRAGTDAAIAFEREREYEVQKMALYALLNQVHLAKELAIHNSSLEYPNERRAQPIVEMPVIAFETAFLTGKDSILAKQFLDAREHGVAPDPMTIISKYLTEAHTINALADLYLTLAQEYDASHRAARDDALERLLRTSEYARSSLNEIDQILTRMLKALPPPSL